MNPLTKRNCIAIIYTDIGPGGVTTDNRGPMTQVILLPNKSAYEQWMKDGCKGRDQGR